MQAPQSPPHAVGKCGSRYFARRRRKGERRVGLGAGADWHRCRNLWEPLAFERPARAFREQRTLVKLSRRHALSCVLPEHASECSEQLASLRRQPQLVQTGDTFTLIASRSAHIAPMTALDRSVVVAVLAEVGCGTPLSQRVSLDIRVFKAEVAHRQVPAMPPILTAQLQEQVGGRKALCEDRKQAAHGQIVDLDRFMSAFELLALGVSEADNTHGSIGAEHQVAGSE